MSIRLQIIYIAVGVIFFFLIMYFIKTRKLNPAYTFLWFVLAIFLISIPVLQDIYIFISHKIFGFYTENLIYLILIGFLIVYVLFLTSKVSRLNDQVKELISYTAILEEKVRSEKLKSHELTRISKNKVKEI